MEIYNVGFLGSTVSAGGGWDYNHNFSTDDGLWSFNDPSSTNQVDTTAGLLRTDTTTSNTSGINRACAGDLLETTVSDTAWVLQIDELNYTTKNNYCNNNFSMSASDETMPSYQAASPSGWQPADLIYFLIYHSTTDRSRIGYSSGGSNGDGDMVCSTDTFSTSTNYYLQSIRTSATSATYQWGANSDFTSPTVDIENTVIPSTIGGLRYLKLGNLVYTGFAEGAMVGSFTTARFADGVTTPP